MAIIKFLLLLISAAHAQTSIPQVVSMKGRVSGDLDRPIAPGSRIRTAFPALVKVQLDAARRMQIGSDSEIGFEPSPDGCCDVRVMKGSVTFLVGNAATTQAEIVTPSVSIRHAMAGEYRVIINRAGESEIVVREGNVQVAAASGSEWVAAGQKMIARGTPANAQFRIVSAISRWRRMADVLASLMHSGGGSASNESGSDESSSNDMKSSAASQGRQHSEASRPSAPPPASPQPRSEVGRAGK
jgi:FecR protein